MKYLVLIYDSEQLWADMPKAELDANMKGYFEYSNAMKKAGAFVGGEQLKPSHTATTVRVRDGKTLKTDGPFAETKEQLGGFYLIEAKNLDEATAWAAKCPSAKLGAIEVRPIHETSAGM